MSGHVYYPDGASFQAGINLTGWAAFMAKATEGTGYRSPAYGEMRDEAARRGARFGAYHFLHAGNASSQADWCHSVVGNGVPLMIDHEPTVGAVRALLGLKTDGSDPDPLHVAARAVTRLPDDLELGHLERLGRASDAELRVGSTPGIQDAAQFADRFRSLGGTCHEIYLPRWYWGNLGGPSLQPLAARGMELVTSNYSGDPESASGPGWATYGGMPTVKTWQYSSTGTVNGRRPVDLNCFRGSGSTSVKTTAAELWALWTTGRLDGGGGAPEPVIQEGAAGPAVTLAQQRLNAWGASPRLAEDGQFGSLTKAAVLAFQRAHYLTADGVVGARTWAALGRNPA